MLSGDDEAGNSEAGVSMQQLPYLTLSFVLLKMSAVLIARL